MLDRNIPLLEIKKRELTGLIFKDMGIEIVHSHHINVDGWIR